MAALGILLVIAGAIVTFAVDTTVNGVDLDVLGYILMAGGAIALIVAAIRAAGWASVHNTDTTMHTERHMSDDGRHYVEETHTA